jgi:uncharacterized protein YuzE
MYFTYDSEADAGYIRFRSKSPGQVAYTRSIDENRNVDYDSSDEPVGVEFLNMSDGVRVDGLPRAEEIRDLIAALRVAA